MNQFSHDIDRLAHMLFETCKAKGIFLATAESCTGGLIAAAITDIAGSSAMFDRGFVTYSNEAKIDMLGVRRETLDQHGAVSKEVALQMAAGAVRHSNATLSIAVTGIAGPGGGSMEKPVGLVHIASQLGTNSFHAEKRFGEQTRGDIRRLTVITALEMCLEAVR
jgi:nicotinamide-nucleotide amidase